MLGYFLLNIQIFINSGVWEFRSCFRCNTQTKLRMWLSWSWECAQSIPRLEKPKNRPFSHKNLKMFDFRFNIPSPFPESGSRKRFHNSAVRAIGFSHDIIPKNMILKKKFQNFLIFVSIHTSFSLNQCRGSIFTLLECAQSIFSMILPLIGSFLWK